MAPNSEQSSHRQDQQHPLWGSDRQIIDRLLQEEPNDYSLVELARLRIRYGQFPGAWDIKADLDKLLQQWQLTEEQLFATTRQLHQATQMYKVHSNKREDWN